jgi:hypothetical protein
MRSTLAITGSWALAFAMLFAPCTISAASQNERPQRNDKKMHDNLVKEVRHQLLLLPYYSVFDNLLYKVDGDKVTLMGQVVRSTLKSDAENVVKEIEGVSAWTMKFKCCPSRRWTTNSGALFIVRFTETRRCRVMECLRCLRFTSS